MKNVGKKAVRNCDLTAAKSSKGEFVGTNGASFAGLRGVGFAVFNGGGGCPLDKVKLKDNCKFYLQNPLFNGLQEFSHHQNGGLGRTHEAVCAADGSKTLNNTNSQHLTSDAVGERLRTQGAELVARFMAQTALNPQKASWRQLNARLNNFAEFVVARRAAEFDTHYGDGWQNGAASGSKALNGAASELHNAAFNSTENSNSVLTNSHGTTFERMHGAAAAEREVAGVANSAGGNKFGFASAVANAANGGTFSNPQNSNLTLTANATDLVAYKNSLLEKNFAALSLRNAVGEVTRFCKWLAKVGAWEGDAEWLGHFKTGKNEGAAKEIGVVLNVEQVKKLLEWLSTQEDENFKVLFNYLVIAFNTGARTGEILALKITDFNFLTQKVTFNKTVVSRKSGSVSHNTKTGAARTLQVSVSVLEAAKRQMQLSKSNEGFLFTNKSGQTFENGTTLSGFYYKACKAALGVTNTRLYNTRHAFVTNSINRDFNNVTAVSKIVGHAKISTTLDNYYATASELNAAEVSPF